MKKITFILAISAMLVACSSPEKRAHKLIQESIKRTVFDMDSYESVEYSKLDTLYSTWEATEVGRVYTKRKDELRVQLDKFKNEQELQEIYRSSPYLFRNEIADYDRRWRAYKIESDSVWTFILSAIKEFTPEFTGWKMTHRFRANNVKGNKIMCENVYYFDKEITEITEQKKIDLINTLE